MEGRTGGSETPGLREHELYRPNRAERFGHRPARGATNRLAVPTGPPHLAALTASVPAAGEARQSIGELGPVTAAGDVARALPPRGRRRPARARTRDRHLRAH